MNARAGPRRTAKFDLPAWALAARSGIHDLELAGRASEVTSHGRAAHVRGNRRRYVVHARRRELDDKGTVPDDAPEIDEEGLRREGRVRIGRVQGHRVGPLVEP